MAASQAYAVAEAVAVSDILSIGVQSPIEGKALPPLPPSEAVLPASAGGCDEAAIRQFLVSESYPVGLINECITSIKNFAVHFFICDDSGSMMTYDGNKLVPDPKHPGRTIQVQCTRWDELGISMRFHAKLAELSGTFCQFKFLNGPTIEYPRDIGTGKLEKVLDAPPGGATPLCKAVLDVERTVGKYAAALRENGQKAVISIFTDGEATDGSLVNAMKPLQLLPVWLVIRLSTDEEKIVNYWNTVDDELELNIDVLDDLVNEAKQVQTINPFLVYTKELHLMREWGMQMRELDSIDEVRLPLASVHKVIVALVGPELGATLPNCIETDLRAYVAAVRKLFHLPCFHKVHNFVSGRSDTWVRADDIWKTYGVKSCAIL